MPDDLRARIAAVQHIHEWHSDGTGEGQCDCDGRWFKNKRLYDLHLADAVIRELGADCIYRYACPHCGDFWFDKSERMQRFALLHGKAHRD